jgi:hypothetical protein
VEREYDAGGMDYFDAVSVVEFMRRVISGAAPESNSVMVGRGAVYAPLEGSSEDEAVDEIASVDRQRAIFVRKYVGMEWPTREVHHMMINSTVEAQKVGASHGP